MASEFSQISNIRLSGHTRLHVGHQNNYYHYGSEADLPSDEVEKRKQDAILTSLTFPESASRSASIESPCESTYDWILLKGNSKYCFTEWLTRQVGMFFISGKAGSGKSTLMKFISNDPRTTGMLARWAGDMDCHLLKASYYLWNSGSELQRSLNGLWRSILVQVMDQQRTLIPLVFPGRMQQNAANLNHLRAQPWTENELRTALKELAKCIADESLCVCLFIDGLDEFGGNELLLREDMEMLLKTGKIKICSSSRPRTIFESAFGHPKNRWMLRLHEHTKTDIAAMVDRRLRKPDHVHYLLQNDSTRVAIAHSITQRANGVFLWAVLVVYEVLRECEQSCTREELEGRLDALPIELSGPKGMFQRVIERIDPRYKTLAARLLLVIMFCLDSLDEPGLHWEQCHFLYKDTFDPEYFWRACLRLDEGYCKRDSFPRARMDCRKIFKACADGHDDNYEGSCHLDGSKLLKDTKLQIRKWCPDFLDTRRRVHVNFAHKSVAEFLRQGEVKARLMEMAGNTFDPALTTCRLIFARLRLPNDMGPLQEGHLCLVARFLRAATAVSEGRVPPCEMLDAFGLMHASQNGSCPLQSTMLQDWSQSARDGIYRRKGILQNFVMDDDLGLNEADLSRAWYLDLAARMGLLEYVSHCWDQLSKSLHQQCGTIIIYGMFDDGRTPRMPTLDLLQKIVGSRVDLDMKITWQKLTQHKLPMQKRLALWEVILEGLSDMLIRPELLQNTAIPEERIMDILRVLFESGAIKPGADHTSSFNVFISAMSSPDGATHSRFAGSLVELLMQHCLLSVTDVAMAREEWMQTKILQDWEDVDDVQPEPSEDVTSKRRTAWWGDMSKLRFQGRRGSIFLSFS